MSVLAQKTPKACRKWWWIAVLTPFVVKTSLSCVCDLKLRIYMVEVDKIVQVSFGGKFWRRLRYEVCENYCV
jgi:hypothetical protein